MTGRITPLLLLFVAACSAPAKPPAVGADCRQDGTCPGGQSCFADFRCYPADADPACSPPCWGAEPYCDKATLRCVACLSSTDCGVGEVCVPPIKRCEPGCSAAKPDCPQGLSCDVSMGACRGCLTDAECTDAGAPACDVATGTCQPCVTDHDSCPVDQYCDVSGAVPACASGCKDDGACDGGTCCGHRCVDAQSDLANCGFCGVACQGAKTCCAGRCADVTSDVDNCSACGVSCELPNVTAPVCSASICSHGACEPFFGNCDGDWDNGCEANFSFDPLHCGNCLRSCPAGAQHTVGACNLGNCTFACATGWGDCNANLGDGCEADLAGSANCGRCGNTCVSPQVCSNGQCQ